MKKQIISCTKCDLCKTRQNAVPGKGDRRSDIVFIGEAPGRSEDKNGQPFVGAAGKKLTAALEEAGLSRDSVYITNVVKCRPPNNRVPTQKEKESCRNYLVNELAIIRPKIICLMGNTVYHSVLGGKQKITKNHGKIVKSGNNLYFLTVHPAATIYNHQLLSSFNRDMKKLAKTAIKLKKNGLSNERISDNSNSNNNKNKKNSNAMGIIPQAFYCRDTVEVAKDLLGKYLVRKIGSQMVSGIITETEAYRYQDDPASHAYRGQTKRNKAMFGQVGKAYVYFTYGMYHCVNVVAKNSNHDAGAVLIRALQPIEGLNIMIKNRKTGVMSNLTNGPAKLAQALKIDKKQYGVDLTKNSDLFITNGIKTKQKIIANSRIGIKNGTNKLWNFKIKM